MRAAKASESTGRSPCLARVLLMHREFRNKAPAVCINNGAVAVLAGLPCDAFAGNTRRVLTGLRRAAAPARLSLAPRRERCGARGKGGAGVVTISWVRHGVLSVIFVSASSAVMMSLATPLRAALAR